LEEGGAADDYDTEACQTMRGATLSRRRTTLDPLLTRVVIGLVSGLLGPAGKRVGTRALEALTGPKDRRALERACRQALRKAVDEARIAGMTDADVTHVLSLLERILAARGADGVPLLTAPESPDNAALEQWRTTAAELGLDPDTFAVAFDPLVTRLLRLIPVEVNNVATEAGSPLFAPVVLRTLDRLGANIAAVSETIGDRGLAQLVALGAGLRDRLDTARTRCRIANRAFLTPDVILVLLDPPDGPARVGFDEVRPGLASTVTNQLRTYLATADVGPYSPFDWTERPDVRRAQHLAWAQQALAVNDAHLLLGVLDTGSSTSRQLAAWLGADFARLRDATASRTRTPEAAGTPGIVFTDMDFM
jgi:hypothetical protein